MANPQVIVDFVANTSGLNKGMSDAGSASEGLGSKLKGMGKAAVMAAGAAGLAALGYTLKVGIDEFSQSAKVAAQTQAVIKSTGGAAGVTAKQVGDLATQLMLKSGKDDEAIQSGENLLLTFRNVQNQAGKGNDIFTQATKTMLDMSVALGQDTSSSAMQLGKALNDPIKGVSQLQRVGVTFTQQQKDQIKALVESGHTMEAQKIILKELNAEFGGSAAAAGKTLPGQLNILKESFNNLAGSIVGTLAPAMEVIAKFFVENPALAKAVVIGILAISAAMVALNVALAVTAVVGSPITIWIIAITAAVAAFIVVIVLLVKNWNKVVGALRDGFDLIKKAGMAVFNWLKSNWPLLLGILGGPIGAAIALIIKNWDTVKSATTAAFDAVKATIGGAFTAIRNTVYDGVEAIKANVTKVWNAVKSVTIDVWQDIRSAIGNPLSTIRDIVYEAVHAVIDNISAAWNTVKTITSTVWGSIRDTVGNVIGAVKGIINGFASFLTNVANGPIASALHGISNVFHFIADGARSAVGAVKGAINDLIGWLWRILGNVRGVASSIADAIKAPINAVIRAWNGLAFHVPSIKIPSIKIAGHKIGGGSLGGFTVGFPNIPLLASGAVVEAPTLAVVGEGRGRELVTPEALLRQILAEQSPNVRVYIGDTELKGIVRAEFTQAGNGLARSLIAGGVS